MTFESCRPAVVDGGVQDNSNVTTRLRKNSIRMIHLQTFQGQRAMSWAADFGTLHKISGMDQAAVIDHVRPIGVSGSPTLAPYILPSVRAPASYSSPPTLRPGNTKDNQPT